MKSSLFQFIGRILNKPAGFLFNVSGEYANAFLIGALVGFPSGAKAVREIYLLDKSEKNKNQAERALAFCNNCSVSFVVSAAGMAVFNSARVGFILFFIQLAAAILTGIITRFIFKLREDDTGRCEPSAPFATTAKRKKDTASITEIISEAVTGILNICGTVLFFYIMINVTVDILKMIDAGFLSPVVSGIFEVSSGVYSLADLNINMYHKLIFCAAVLGWSGFSVHLQIIYILKDLKLSLRPYFTGKIIHVIIYIILTALIFKMPEMTALCFSGDYYPYYPAFFNTPDNYQAYLRILIASAVITLTVILVISVALLIFYMLEKKKMKN